MKNFLDSKKSRIIFSLLVLLVAGIVAAAVSFSTDNLDYEKSDVELLYDNLLVQNDELINSDKYLVTDEFISRIPPKTTIDEFTKNINRDDFVLTYNNVKVTEGLVKTGMVLTRGDEKYTLVVAGDLNKDGLMNYVDISAIIESAKAAPADVVVGKASDFNEDGKYDKTDVTNSVDYILNQKLELKEVKPVEGMPSLEIVSGELGERNWYRGDVVVKIKTNDALKTSYKVIGTSTQRGVDVSDGHEITLSGYGAYKIIAWNYGEEGNRSSVTTMTFKIDDREIIPTVTYSTTDITSEKVVATVTFNKENVFITNNNGKNTVTFYENGNFQFQYKDLTGRTGRTTAMVNWMEDAVGADGKWRYTYVNDEEIYLREYLDEIDENTELVVPAEYDGYKVYGVGNNTKYYNILGVNDESKSGTLFNYVISEGIKEIGDYAFYLVGKESENLSIPNTVTKIGDSAFNVMGAFFSLEGGLTLSEQLEYIGNDAFFGCSFYHGDLVIPNNVSQIGARAFSNSSFTGKLFLPEKLEFIGEEAFAYNAFSGSLIIPDNVETIGNFTFTGNMFDGNLIISDSVETIGVAAFADNVFTGGLVIPESVKSIGMAAFNANNFTGQLVINAKLKDIEIGTFSGNGFTGTLVIPDTVETIGRDAFSYNYFIGNLVIPDSVIKIDENAFYHSGSYSSLVLSKNLQVIGPFAFSQSVISGSLVIPNKVTSVGMCAFEYAGFTGDLIIGNGVKTIEYGAFNSNGYAGDLVIGNSLTNLDWVSDSGIDLSKFTGSLSIGDGITEIPSFFFENSGFTGDLIIGDGVTDIGTDAFANTSFAGSLSLGSSLKTISENAFYNNSFTGSLVIPDSVETINAQAFANNSFNGTLTLGKNLKFIGISSFINNSFVGDLVIPDSVTTLGMNSFNTAGFTGKLVIGKGYNHIPPDTFRNNGFTGDLIIPEGVEYVWDYSFADNNFDGVIVIASTVTEIAAGAFKNNTNLTGTVDASRFEGFDITAFDSTGVTVINYEE